MAAMCCVSDNTNTIILCNNVSPVSAVLYLLACFLQDKSLLMLTRMVENSLNMNGLE